MKTLARIFISLGLFVPFFSRASDISIIALPVAIPGQQDARIDTSRCEHTNTEFRCVKFLYNHDGDTLTVSISNIHPLLGQKISVRVFGVDTPEMYSSDPCERDAAITAQKFVRLMATRSHRMDLVQVQRDKYFRILADVRLDGESLAQALISRGLAYPYYGGTKQVIDWCPARSVTIE